MKKFLVIVLSSLFVLSFAVAGFAAQAEIPADTTAVTAKGATQVTIDGNIRIRGEMRNNTNDLQSDRGTNQHDTWSYYDHRVRLGVNAKLEKVTGRILLESGSGSTDTFTPGGGTGGQGTYPKGNAKEGTLEILESWIQYKGDTIGLKAGHMPLALGNKLFFDHSKFGDDAIVFFMDPTKEIHVGVLTAKFDELSSSTAGNADDTDVYVALATFKSDAFNASADLAYVVDGINYINNSGNAAATSAEDSTKLMNIGVRGDAKVGPLTVKADIEFQSGTAEKAISATQDMDYSGQAIMLGASIKVDPVSLGLEIGRGSGNDSATANEYEGFVTSLSSGVPYIGFIYGTRLAPAGKADSSNTTNSGINNTTYVKATGAAKVGPVGLDVALIWLQATEEVAMGSELGGTDTTKDSDLGMELDAKATYALAKNLNYWVEAGYFMPGDAYKFSATQDPDNAYAIRHGLELSF